MANVEGLDEALNEMREEGRRAGYAEGYSAGRQHAAAILGHAEAKGREPLASKLAANTGITPEQAAEMLAASPKADDGSYLAKLSKDSPKLETPEPAPTDEEARRKELQSMTKAVVAARRR